MDYYKIGQKIRKYRKAHHLSQEELAEKVEISVTHMSHIETGNTKLSLPVLVALATALEVSTDELLFAKNAINKTAFMNEITQILENCSTQQIKIMRDIISATKVSLDKYL